MLAVRAWIAKCDGFSSVPGENIFKGGVLTTTHILL